MSTELIVGFNSGEVSRNIESRVDLPLYKKACSVVENFDVLPEGGVRNRSGTKFISKALDPTNRVHLQDFSYSDDESYIFEFGDLTCRIWRVQDESFVETLVTPYLVADVAKLQWDRSYDVMWFVHPDYPDQTITRNSLTDFSIEETDYDFPPMSSQNRTETTITPSARTGSIALVATEPIFLAGHVGSTWLIKQSRVTASLIGGIQYGTSITDTVTTPGDGETDWLNVAFSDYSITTDDTWNARLSIELSTDGGATSEQIVLLGDTTAPASAENFLEVSDLRLKKASLIRLKWSGLTGTLKYNMSVEDSYNYGLVKITAFTDTKNVTATVLSDLYDTSATTLWSEAAFSAVNGYPRTIALFEERRFLSGTRNEPNMVWGSTSDDFYNHFAGLRDNEAIMRFPPVNGHTSWMLGKDSLTIGTSSEILTVTGLTSTQGLTPTNFKFNVQTSDGSEYIQAEIANDIIIYTQKGGKKLREFIYNDTNKSFMANDLSALAKHITSNTITTTALQKTPDQRVLCVLQNGELAPLTYERTEEVVAWQRYVTQGNFDSVAVAVNGEEDSTWHSVLRDGEYCIETQVTRDISGGKYWFLDSAVETTGVEDAPLDSVSTSGSPDYFVTINKVAHGLSDGMFVGFDSDDTEYLNDTIFTVADKTADTFALKSEDGSVYVSATDTDIVAGSSTGTFYQVHKTVTGLSHLEGKEVGALCDIKNGGTYTVTSAVITLDEWCKESIVGLAYTSTVSPLPIELMGQFISSGHYKSIANATLKLKDSLGGSVGSDLLAMEPLVTRTLEDPAGSQEDLINDDIPAYFQDSWENVKRVYIQQTLPLPFELLSISFEMQSKGR